MSFKKITIDSELDISEIKNFLETQPKVELSPRACERIIKCREWLDKKLDSQKKPVYGINTGFGSFCNIKIDKAQLSKLQENLMLSHACGTGEIVPDEITKLMMLLKIQSLCLGYSGVQIKTVELLIEFLNRNIIPIVYEQGSLGASGDLVPLAHLCLPLIGKGKVKFNGKIQEASEVLKELKIEPIKLQSKEGLALLNGTQFMLAYAVYTVIYAKHLNDWADVIGALSLDAYDGIIDAFHPLISEVRPYNGQIETSRRIRKILEGSELIASPKDYVQDPYSFRCIPQVHGSSRDAINYCYEIIQTEVNSVTDNPIIFPDDDLILSGGNFHGQPLALVLDFMSIAMSELANISERRTYRLISGKRGLPDLLIARPGLNSGFMIPQYTAASIVNQNKILCYPASADSIETCQGQEDHVSMGANAALKAYKILHNLKKVLAIELFNAAQAIEFRRPKKTSPYLENILAEYRKIVPFINDDVLMQPFIEKTINFIDTYKLEKI